MSVSFEPALMAESLTNILAGTGLALVARAKHRINPYGPVTKRSVFALGLLSAFFLIRGMGWLANSSLAGQLATALAGATPLVALFVVEGLLRRHAPPRTKAGFALGALVIAALALLNARWTLVNEAALFTLVVGGYSHLTWLLVTRDKSSLTTAENRSIRRLLVALPIVLITVSSDFRGLFAFIPLRLGALGVLVLLYGSFGAAGLRAPGWTRILNLCGFLVIAVVLAVGLAATAPPVDSIPVFDIAAAIFSGLVLAGLVSEEIGARSERARPLSPLLRASDPIGFAAALKSDLILQDATILCGPELGDVESPALVALLHDHAILRRQEAPWGLPAESDGVERALSLLMTYDASHLMRLGLAPLRIAVFAVPPITDDPRTAMDIAIAQRLGEALYMMTPARP